MDIYEPRLIIKFAVHEEPAIDDRTIAPGELVGRVLLEVDDNLMGGLGRAHHESTERLRQRINFGKWHRLLQHGPSSFGGRHFTQLPVHFWSQFLTWSQFQLVVRLYQFIITFPVAILCTLLHRENASFEVWYLHEEHRLSSCQRFLLGTCFNVCFNSCSIDTKNIYPALVSSFSESQ